jgi:predicted amidophosphoribosyltransferase
MLLKIDCLLEKYFEDNLDFYQEFTFAPVPLHFNKIKERAFDQAFLIVRQVTRAVKLTLAGGVLRRVKAAALLVTISRNKAEQRILLRLKKLVRCYEIPYANAGHITQCDDGRPL